MNMLWYNNKYKEKKGTNPQKTIIEIEVEAERGGRQELANRKNKKQTTPVYTKEVATFYSTKNP